MRTIRPLKDHVLVKQDSPKAQLKSGLFLPQGSRDLYDDYGTVIAVGPGIAVEGGEIIPVSVKPGDRVMFKRRPASLINPDAREGDEWFNYLMLKDEDIVAVLDQDAIPSVVEVETATCTVSPKECECH